MKKPLTATRICRPTELVENRISPSFPFPGSLNLGIDSIPVSRDQLLEAHPFEGTNGGLLFDHLHQEVIQSDFLSQGTDSPERRRLEIQVPVRNESMNRFMSLNAGRSCSDHGEIVCAKALAGREVKIRGTSLFQRRRGKEGQHE
jgi:hypothetical protein